jgi:hypothetical protein
MGSAFSEKQLRGIARADIQSWCRTRASTASTPESRIWTSGFQGTAFTLLYLPLKTAIIYNGTEKLRSDMGFHEFRLDFFPLEDILRFGPFLGLALLLFFLWIGGFIFFHVAGFLIHLLLIFAVVSLIIHLFTGARTA